ADARYHFADPSNGSGRAASGYRRRLGCLAALEVAAKHVANLCPREQGEHRCFDRQADQWKSARRAGARGHAHIDGASPARGLGGSAQTAKTRFRWPELIGGRFWSIRE